MGLMKRVDREIAKLEKKIQKEHMRLEKLEQQYKDKKITKAKLHMGKKDIEQKIKNYKNRIGTLKGLAVKEKHNIEEKKAKKLEE